MPEAELSGRMTVDFPKCDLWDFSRQFYQGPEVESCCLYLQNQYGANVNLVLLACWVGVTGRGVLSHEQFAELAQQVDVWQAQVIKPLRQVRQQLKNMSGYGDETIRQLRRNVMDCELDAEHREQLMLERALEFFLPINDISLEQRYEDVMHSLQHYFAVLQIPKEDAMQQCHRLIRELQRWQHQQGLAACMS